MNDIIKEVFLNDILNELINEYDNYKHISKEKYKEFCKERIKIYIEQIKLENNINKKFISRDIFKNKKDRCKARIWSNGYGGQCSCKNILNGFCKTHFTKGGENWWIGTIDKPRPKNPVDHTGKIHTWLN